MRLSRTQVRKFQREVLGYYRKHARNFPWRSAREPYRTLVSEVMLQQTQVSRVVPFYARFIKAFPTITSLARAKTGDVLRAWQGLGYNRRALNLQRAARVIVQEYGARVPRDTEALEGLAGIGNYTAGAIMAFAFNQPSAFIETNIRTVYLHHFFKRKYRVTDEEILTAIRQTRPKKNPRVWYQALMDYGTMLKKREGNQNVRSASFAKQALFHGSRREVRGAVLKVLSEKPLTMKQLEKVLMARKLDVASTVSVVSDLVKEEFIVRTRGVLSLY